MPKRIFVAPAYRSCPDYQLTYGPAVADFCADVGFAPDPEQELALDMLFAISPEDPDRSAIFEMAMIGPRQTAGKTGLAKQAILGWIYVLELKEVTYSAHRVETSTGVYTDLRTMIEDDPVLARLLPNTVSRGFGSAPGRETINFSTRQRVRFRVRSDDGGRGLGGDKVIIDEALDYGSSQGGALLPILAVRPDPQILYLSSAGKLESSELRIIRDRGRGGKDRGLGYLEWGSDRAPCQDPKCQHIRPDMPGWKSGCLLDDEGLWARTNPQLHRRAHISTMRGFRRSMDPREFSREFLGWWEEPSFVNVFGASTWERLIASCVDDMGKRRQGLPTPADFALEAIGVAVAVDLKSAAIVGAGLRGDRVATKVLATGPGTSWVLDEVRRIYGEHQCQIVIDGGGPSAPLAAELKKIARRRFTAMNLPQYKDACAGLFQAVQDATFEHGDEPELNLAVSSATWRNIGDRRVWGRSGGDISPLEALTCAHWRVTNKPQLSAADERLAAGESAVMSV